MIGNAIRIAFKDLRLLWADKLGLFWVLGFPLIMALFFGSIFGGGGGGGAGAIDIAIVDLDRSQGSRRLVELLEEAEALRVWRPADTATGEPINVTEAMARDQVRQGYQTAYIVIPEGYAGDGPFGGLGAELRVGIDPSRRAEAGYLQGLIMAAAFRRLQDIFLDRDAMAAEVDKLIVDVDSWGVGPAQETVFRGFFASLKTFMQEADPGLYPDGERDPLADGATPTEAGPVKADDGRFSPVRLSIEEITQEGVGPRSAFEVTFPQAMIWAVIGACSTFAVTLVRERKEGTLLRLRIAPHPIGVILAGKALACFLTCVGSLALLTAIAHLGFGMRIESYALYAVGVMCTGVCFVGIMMAVTTIGTTEESVGGAGFGVLLILTMIGGGMIPLLFMPPWLAALSRISPARWLVWSMEGAVWRGLTFGQLLPSYAMLTGVGLVSFTFGVWVFRRREA